ncbi:hypothetical protein EVAR_9823_1 [Eumeta japonica]|uniref:Uncharacterized protein n=1 Tax=Eumeta variegata TaxID=151549 RepID=A0A4C1U5U7_EUMVA|nr:hypothetical protein EVAR_9823_1 [Eumeta japonica]
MLKKVYLERRIFVQVQDLQRTRPVSAAYYKLRLGRPWKRVTVAYGHRQRHRSHRCFVGLLRRNRISDEQGSGWWRERGGVCHRTSRSLNKMRQRKLLLYVRIL